VFLSRFPLFPRVTSEQPKVVVKDRAVFVQGVSRPLILMHPGIERLHLDRRIARIGSLVVAQIRASVGVRVTEHQYRTAIARLAFDSNLVGAEPSLEKIRPRAALVRELDREKGAKLLRYRCSETRCRKC
jgi:hypothetical protein